MSFSTKIVQRIFNFINQKIHLINNSKQLRNSIAYAAGRNWVYTELVNGKSLTVLREAVIENRKQNQKENEAFYIGAHDAIQNLIYLRNEARNDCSELEKRLEKPKDIHNES